MRAYPDPVFTRLMEEAYREWHKLERQTSVKLIKETGLLCFSDDKNQFIDDIAKSLQSISGGDESRKLNSANLRKDYPSIRLADTATGCFDPSGGVILADKALKSVQNVCEGLGVDIHDGDGIQDVTSTQDSVHITTTSGVRHSAESCVICAGPWAGSLLQKLGCSIPLRPIKVPVFYWAVGPQFINHTWIYEGKEEWDSIWGLPSVEYPGLVKICAHDGPAIDPDRRDSASTEHIKAKVADFIRSRFDGVKPEVAVEESCIYTTTPDWNPVIDTLPGTSNIVIGAGFSGHGFKLGPVTGRMLADLAQGITTRQDIPQLSLDR